MKNEPGGKREKGTCFPAGFARLKKDAMNGIEEQEMFLKLPRLGTSTDGIVKKTTGSMQKLLRCSIIYAKLMMLK